MNDDEIKEIVYKGHKLDFGNLKKTPMAVHEIGVKFCDNLTRSTDDRFLKNLPVLL